METVEDWDEFRALVGSKPKVSRPVNFNNLSMICYYPTNENSEGSDSSVVPVEFSGVGEELEEMFKEIYRIDIEGYQSTLSNGSRDYCRGIVKGFSGGSCDLGANLRLHYPISNGSVRSSNIGLSLVLPTTNEYKRATKTFLSRFWPRVIAIENNFPDPIPSLHRGRYFGLGAIALNLNGDVIAKGYPCFSRVDLSLERKPVLD
jgi:hypothetical protein